MIRAARLEDAERLAAIYNWYIGNSSCTFEQDPLDVEQMRMRLQIACTDCPWLVLEQNGSLLGYAYASVWKTRTAYKLSRETTIYLDREVRGAGHGKRLYQHLIDELSKTPIHSLIASIALPNQASIALHESLGFKKVGQFSDVGYKFEKFIDVGYWQLIL